MRVRSHAILVSHCIWCFLNTFMCFTEMKYSQNTHSFFSMKLTGTAEQFLHCSRLRSPPLSQFVTANSH